METREALHEQLLIVEKWEADQKDLWFWEKLGRLPFALLDKVTPQFLQKKAGEALDEMVGYIDTGGKYLISADSLLVRFQKASGDPTLTLESLSRLPLSLMDSTAAELSKSRSTFATVQGATTGFGGVFTLALDIPVLLGLSLKTLQEIAICYGYDPKEKAERAFMIKVLQFTSSDFVGKKAIIEDLTAYGDPDRNRQVFAQLQGWREVLLVQAENYGWKKLFQLIPVAGMVFGAYVNKKTIDELAETAKMLYRKRRILERLAEME
ncbi:EcsC family protein [Tumebacillus sp. DT12]|uniref:EcsC family protein n=1 Tax=Tumebacillus lacus TaxID=2995335 RepID=A0ABT3WZL5_9BACL|nr:EcsC family protein [Tumebacillus lacus]MCX7569168.1 EcsC family protein [Tumebacillus lacus]